MKVLYKQQKSSLILSSVWILVGVVELGLLRFCGQNKIKMKQYLQEIFLQPSN